jgi:predicted nucleotidyltransferase
MINAAAIKHEMIRLIKAHSPSGLVVAVYVFGSCVRSDEKDSKARLFGGLKVKRLKEK